jgi:hypothetical protein
VRAQLVGPSCHFALELRADLDMADFSRRSLCRSLQFHPFQHRSCTFSTTQNMPCCPCNHNSYSKIKLTEHVQVVLHFRRSKPQTKCGTERKHTNYMIKHNPSTTDQLLSSKSEEIHYQSAMKDSYNIQG